MFDLCIPAFNEEAIIGDTVTALKGILSRTGESYRIIVVDNGSTDSTTKKAQEAGADVITIPMRGKGRAVVVAAQSSTAEIFGFIDADLPCDLEDVENLYQLVRKGVCDIAIGSKVCDSYIIDRKFHRKLMTRVFNALRYLILGLHVKDSQAGLKLMNTSGSKLLVKCQETGWFFDIEFLALAERRGLSVREVGIHLQDRNVERTSRIRIVRDSIGAIAAMLRIRSRLHIPVISRLRQTHEAYLLKIARYLFSGGTATMVNLTVLYYCTSILGVWYIYSAFIAFLVAFSVSFTLQKFWTFRDMRTHKVHRQILLFFAVQLGALGVNIAGLYVLTEYVGLWYFFSQIIIFIGISVTNFVIFSKLIFHTV